MWDYRALIDSLVKTQGVDPGRVYLTGYANGAGLAYYLACQSAGVAAWRRWARSCGMSRPPL
jgi:poly(3-hydroxybutyrate) depolymerase